ncbi:transmembrane protein 179B [Lampris incognitus]|uniref:transmembrane protein 179B n=1 Tax=Lampris incognitus TaxID=2546036 RepID=UPI0024B4DD08|nr:transmembrane protein 179B [Lampris incognitus]
MALPWLLLAELALYASCFVCGIVTAASLTINQGNFGGLCMLYGTVAYNTTAGAITTKSSSSASLCYFVSAVSVMVAVVCFSLSLYWLYTCCVDGQIHRERVWMNLTLGLCAVFLFFLLITGCMLKIGRDSLCSSVTQAVPNITRCEEAQSKTWASPVDGVKFYTSLHKAETAVWVNFFFWLIIAVLVSIQKKQNSGFKMVDMFGGALAGGDSSPTSGETEPFFNRPARPQ